MEYHLTFHVIAATIGKIFVLMLVGCGISHLKLVSEEFIDTLSLLLVRVLVPALIISKTIVHFSFTEYPLWWFIPLCAIAYSVAGMLIGLVVFPLLKGFKSKKEFMCASGFHNCGYLPMNLILFAFAGLLADRLLIYTFLFIAGFNLLMWCLVPLFLTGKLRSGINPKVFLNPPVIAIIFSLLWVAIFGRGTMPAIVMDPLTQLGQATFPVAMLVLGAYLYLHRAHRPDNMAALIAGVGIKLFIFPAIVLGVLVVVPLDMSYKFFLFLEATMPAAVSLVVIGSYTGADNRFFSSVIFYTHLVAIVSIPLWLALFEFLTCA